MIKVLIIRVICIGAMLFLQNNCLAKIIKIDANRSIENIGQDIVFKQNGNKKLIPNVFQYEGQLIEEPVRFNNQPAILNWATAGSIKQRFNFTLKLEKNSVLIDCVYGALYDSGIVIRKAICGLNRKLDSNYAGLVDLIPDFNTNLARSIIVNSFEKNSGWPIVINQGKIGELRFYLKYSDPTAFENYAPENIVSNKKKTIRLKNESYLVYMADQPNKVKRIDMVQDDTEEEHFKSYTRHDLQQLFSNING